MSAFGNVLTRKRYGDFGAVLPTTITSTLVSQPPSFTFSFPSALGTNAHADNFTWNNNTATITSINCWGVYPAGVHPDNFTGVIYLDAGGQPGSQFTTFTVPSTLVTRTATSTNVGGLQVYFYTLTLSPSINLPPGSFWLALANNSSWNILASFSGNGISAKSSSVFGPAWTTDTPDMAFALVNSMTVGDATGNHFEFGGNFKDAETGLINLPNRQLDTLTGQVIERNPFGPWRGPWRDPLWPWDHDGLGNGLTFADDNPTTPHPDTTDQQPPGVPIGGNCNDAEGQDPCKDPCATAKAAGLDNGDAGGVVCCHKVKISCAWIPGGGVTTTEPGQGIIKKCIIAHEDVHHDHIDCPKNKGKTVTRPDFKAGVTAKAGEYAAYTAEKKCLDDSKKDCGDNAACKTDVQKRADFVQRQAEKNAP